MLSKRFCQVGEKRIKGGDFPFRKTEQIAEVIKKGGYLKKIPTSCSKPQALLLRSSSLISDTPIAFISMMSKDLQWIKAKVGVEMDLMPKTSLCIHALQMDEMMSERCCY